MKFNYHAVSKKDRIKKTLLFGVPASVIVGLVGSLVLYLATQIGINLVYYIAVLSIGYVMGSLVRKIGRGTTSEFLVIAGVLGVFSVLLAMYFYFLIFIGRIPMRSFFQLLFSFNIGGYFSFVEVLFAGAVAVYQANTVQIR